VELDPVAASRMEPTNRRRVVRALEVTIGSGRPFSSFGPGLEQYPPSRFQLIGVELPLDVVAARIETRYHEQVAAGFVEEAARLLADPRGVSRTARQALGRLLQSRRSRRAGGAAHPAVRPAPAIVVPPRSPHPLAAGR
jgi:tRNA dimethylallyltransferase